MPKATINTYSTYNVCLDGEVKAFTVSKIFSEENVRPVSKEVGIFEKYTTKKNITSKCKFNEGIER